MLNKTANAFSFVVLLVNLLAVVLLLASAVSGFVSPQVFSWSVSLSLCFPFFVLANVVFVIIWLIAQSRRWLWSFCGLLACSYALFTYCPVNMPEPAPEGSIKVISYNTYGFGDGDKDSVSFAQMMEFLSTSDANILCAQETNYTPSRKKAVENAVAHWPYTDSVLVEATHNALTIFSDYPILSRHVIHSSSTSHLCAVYMLQVGEDTVCVVNSHFVSNAISTDDKETYHRLVTASDQDSSKQDVLRLCRKINEAGTQRAEQADLLADYLDTLGDMPIIVCGDFNDSPLSYVHHRLVRNLNDAYTASGIGPGISYHMSKMFFRLDNILCSHHWKAYGADVDAHQKMSDHYPIQVWLKKVE